VWPDRDRVAELIVTHAHGRSRGSGYRIDATRVLTAAHVVENAVSVTVRFSPDLPSEQTVTAVSWQADPVADIAHIEIPPQSGEAVRFGRVGTSAAVLQAQAVGFPLWKMRDGQYRDSHHAVGTVAVLSNFREGTLEFVVPTPPAAVEGRSPWEGMSGAALWVDGRIVGVVSKHHPSDGLGRLAVAPLAGDFPDVVTQPGKYDALLADIAPDELLDRSQELAELVSFCAGDEPYMWWQAGPWAGKTALMSWFASHPPAGIDVVSFFITAGQSDSGMFLESVIEQLGEPTAPNRANLLRLLQKAAAGGRRLLLVVDGLDEDTSKQAVGRPSIASLLPRRVPSGLRVLVASRPNPDLPDDVPGDHPLRTVTPRPLVASSRARHIEIAARNELSQLLQGEPLYRDILGLLTASGSGLTVPDLEELTGLPRYELDRVFGSLFARSLTSRQQAFVFAHKTLREAAEQQYGTSLRGFRDRLHAWAKSYQDSGWPPGTPAYLLFGYPELLVATGDVERLTALGVDRVRHARMFEHTGADLSAMAEIGTTAALVGAAERPNLTDLLRLAFASKELEQRSNIPIGLPAVWAVLGELDRAVALAKGTHLPAAALQSVIGAVPVPQDVVELAETTAYAIAWGNERAKALSALATVITEPGRCFALIEAATGAAQLAHMDHEHDLVFAQSARAAAARGHYGRATDLALACREVHGRVAALNAVATVAALEGDRARSHELARRAAAIIAGSAQNEWTRIPSSWERVTGALTAIGHGDQVTERYLREAERPENHSQIAHIKAYAGAVAALAPAGDQDLVRTAVSSVRSDAIELGGPRCGVLADLGMAASELGDRPQYEDLAAETETALRTVDSASQRVSALTTLMRAAARIGDPHRCPVWAAQAESAAMLVEPPSYQIELMTELAMAAAVAGDHDRARGLLETVQVISHSTAGGLSILYLGDIALAASMVDDDRRAEAVASLIIGGNYRSLVLAKTAARVATSGNLGRAVELVAAAQASRKDAHPDHFSSLCEIAKAVALIGDDARYRVLVGKAEDMAGNGPFRRAERLADVAAVAARAGDLARTVKLVAEVEDVTEIYVSAGLESVVEALAVAGDHDEAERLARLMGGGLAAFAELVPELLTAGQLDRAERLAREITDEHTAPKVLGDVAAAAAAAGEQLRAILLVETAEEIARTITGSSVRDSSLGELASALSAARDLDDVTRRLVVEVLTTPSWPSALAAVARLDPAAIANLCDEVSGGRDRRGRADDELRVQINLPDLAGAGVQAVEQQVDGQSPGRHQGHGDGCQRR
jgi:hypothetical protein